MNNASEIRILIVEDSGAMREVIADYLQGEGYVCEAVDNGKVALGMIREKTYDLILTDLRLPGADGFTVVEEANRLHPDTPKILMTAFSQIEDTLRAIKLGAYDFIRKPIPNLGELGLVINRALEHRRLVREREAHLQEIERINLELEHLNENLEKEVERRAGDLAKANQQLRTLDEMKNNLLANISHELRTPLVSVRGYTELFHAQHFCPIPEDKRVYLQTCLRNIDKLLELIEGLVRYADMVRDKKPEIDLAYVDLREVVQKEAEQMASRASEKGIHLVVNLPEDEVPVHLDMERTEQSLQQLIDNAIKFNNAGCRITVEVERLGRRLAKISVTDTGIGIPLEEQGRIFERFYQIHSGPTRAHGGTGMGLAIARDNLRLMGSELRVNSEPGAGSRFFWTMPLCESSAPDPERSTRPQLA